ncbi:unnamed protein product [Paramecium sonneborni]|uniref:Uncharacterized protein n=1 Tax=Paramecium sonneborni TaxID=65129 RepID=A0A8S1RRY1_9CILI|nr:unnamed protein product [Paramecium sonneborni]
MKKLISTSSYSRYKLNNNSTRIDSFPDSTRVLQMNISHYEDALSQEVFISTTYEHIREVRDLIANSRQSIKPLREAISQLRYQIQTIEYQQKKDQINSEYDISQCIQWFYSKKQINLKLFKLESLPCYKIKFRNCNTMIKKQFKILTPQNLELLIQLLQLDNTHIKNINNENCDHNKKQFCQYYIFCQQINFILLNNFVTKTIYDKNNV